MELRDYQLDAVYALRDAVRAGYKRILLQASTGVGKTVVASEIMRASTAKEKRCLFLAHRRELVDQCSDKLSKGMQKHPLDVLADVA